MVDFVAPAYKQLPELAIIEALLAQVGSQGRVRSEVKVVWENTGMPIYSLSLGPNDPTAPVLAVFAGVHGLERVGTHVAISYLETLLSLMHWDVQTQELLQKVRVVFMPLINPIGMYLLRRSNGNHVDLMRNAPIDAEELCRVPFVSGQRYSPKIPWYRGKLGDAMETEAQAVVDFVRREIFGAKVAVSLDLHSGFGRIDRLWFPYAKAKRPFGKTKEIWCLKNLLDRTYPNHVYQVEPQAHQYTTHGDLWDYLYDLQAVENPNHLYLPLCLEMGSWMWVKKNPRQLFSSLGIFNPFIEHRFKRVLRRHLALLDFLLRAVGSSKNWLPQSEIEHTQHHHAAMKHWWPLLKP